MLSIVVQSVSPGVHWVSQIIEFPLQKTLEIIWLNPFILWIKLRYQTHQIALCGTLLGTVTLSGHSRQLPTPPRLLSHWGEHIVNLVPPAPWGCQCHPLVGRSEWTKQPHSATALGFMSRICVFVWEGPAPPSAASLRGLFTGHNFPGPEAKSTVARPQSPMGRGNMSWCSIPLSPPTLKCCLVWQRGTDLGLKSVSKLSPCLADLQVSVSSTSQFFVGIPFIAPLGQMSALYFSVQIGCRGSSLSLQHQVGPDWFLLSLLLPLMVQPVEDNFFFFFGFAITLGCKALS